MDTVYQTGFWRRSPYRVDGNRIYGPASPTKGRTAVILHSLKILTDAGWRDYARLTVMFIRMRNQLSGIGEQIAEIADQHDSCSRANRPRLGPPARTNRCCRRQRHGYRGDGGDGRTATRGGGAGSRAQCADRKLSISCCNPRRGQGQFRHPTELDGWRRPVPCAPRSGKAIATGTSASPVNDGLEKLQAALQEKSSPAHWSPVPKPL